MSLLIKEFRRGIAFSLRLSGVEAATSTRILLGLRDPRAVRTDLTIDRQSPQHSPEVGRSVTNHQTEGYAGGGLITMIRSIEP
jgi:hypothetical protein